MSKLLAYAVIQQSKMGILSRHGIRDNNCFCVGFPKKDPADLQKLYPSASAKAVRLIGQMLKMEPDSRISAEDALNDPYLSWYHDPNDEPVCIPVFDFGFEKQVAASCDVVLPLKAE